MPAVSFTVPDRVITAVCLRNGVADSQANFETIMKDEWKAITNFHEGEVARSTTVTDAGATADSACATAEALAESEIAIS